MTTAARVPTTVTAVYILTVIEHAIRRIRVLGVTAHPAAVWVGRATRNLVMDLEDTGFNVKYLINLDARNILRLR